MTLTALDELDAKVAAMTPGRCSVLHSDQPIIRGEHNQNLLMVEDCNQADENAVGFAAIRNAYADLSATLRDALSRTGDGS